MQSFIERYHTIIIRIVVGVGILLGLFLFAATLVKIKTYRYVGTGVTATNTITVNGTGKVNETPDTARISFTVQQESKLVADAQQSVTTKISAITTALKNLGIDDSDITTDSYSSYPQYDYSSSTLCVPGGPCGSGTPVIRGYQVSHAITVSVKNLDKVPDVLKVLGDNQVSDLSGPNFGFADDNAVHNQARDAAIADAKVQAQTLAKSLGVHLVRIVSFTESGDNNPMPLYAAKDSVASSAGAAPTVPVGNQDIESNVTLVYEIQ